MPITDATRTGIRAVLADRGPRRQPLSGFDADYHDIVHYILRCTYRIWEQRGIELIRTHYAPAARVITLAGESASAQAVIDSTRGMLAAFPDRRLAHEDVIWCRLPGSHGYFSSHRILSRMTQIGASEFGPPTGRVARFRTIADCYVRANRIYLEWLARDNLLIAQQLGADPWQVAAALARKDSAAFVKWRTDAARRLLASGRWQSEAPAHAPLTRSLRAWVADWAGAINTRNWPRFERLFAAPMRAFLPRERRASSAGALAAYWMELIEAMPDLRVAVDRVTELPARRDETRVAIRWWAAGVHANAGRFGRPSGVPVLLFGVSHLRLDAGRVTREWLVFDELSMLRQIAAARLRR